ncbi:MAG TPA: sulfotransferase [Saprospiraceae bacterium]|nr:sulfotransferase [Saprospiraceae bacterium]HMQ83735.1 sulfotransferase [Saprospiraceae bacterium]
MINKLQKGFYFLEKKAYEKGWLKANAQHLPDFIGIGAQKSGTTWLYLNLKQHPDIQFAKRIIREDGKWVKLPLDQKELRYFKNNDRFYSPMHHYTRHFEDLDSSKLKGEITPDYAIMGRDRIRFMHTIMPNAKLILLVRNPIQRAWSHAKMDLVKRGGQSIEQLSDETVWNHFNGQGAISRGSYSRILDKYYQFFPKEQLFVGFYEDISTEPEALFINILQFLGLSTEQLDLSRYPLSDRVGSGIEKAIPEKYYQKLLQLYGPEIKRFAEKYEPRAGGWIN